MGWIRHVGHSLLTSALNHSFALPPKCPQSYEFQRPLLESDYETTENSIAKANSGNNNSHSYNNNNKSHILNRSKKGLAPVSACPAAFGMTVCPVLTVVEGWLND